MDINFHYFAIRTIAEKAGFSAADAQRLACYSQFVDDYDITFPFFVAEVPDYAAHLCKDTPYGKLFSPVTTGFNSWFDMAMLVREKNQEYIVTPFHFVPHAPLNAAVADRAAYRVVPQRPDAESLLWGLLEEARDAYRGAGESDKPVRLIQLGLLCHIFADTYAHQNFSGLWGWENHCRLEAVTDNEDGGDITDGYSPSSYFRLPSIGHTNANHAPDDSNVSYWTAMRRTEGDAYEWHYGRNNTREFLLCAHVVFNYLRSCQNLPPVEETEPFWAEISEGLRLGFLTSLKSPSRLCGHWKALFPDIGYGYSREPLLENVLEISRESLRGLENMDEESALGVVLNPHSRDFMPVLLRVRSDDFYRYNVFAKEVRDAVNGRATEPHIPPELENGLNRWLQSAQP